MKQTRSESFLSSYLSSHFIMCTTGAFGESRCRIPFTCTASTLGHVYGSCRRTDLSFSSLSLSKVYTVTYLDPTMFTLYSFPGPVLDITNRVGAIPRKAGVIVSHDSRFHRHVCLCFARRSAVTISVSGVPVHSEANGLLGRKAPRWLRPARHPCLLHSRSW